MPGSSNQPRRGLLPGGCSGSCHFFHVIFSRYFRTRFLSFCKAQATEAKVQHPSTLASSFSLVEANSLPRPADYGRVSAIQFVTSYTPSPAEDGSTLSTPWPIRRIREGMLTSIVACRRCSWTDGFGGRNVPPRDMYREGGKQGKELC